MITNNNHLVFIKIGDFKEISCSFIESYTKEESFIDFTTNVLLPLSKEKKYIIHIRYNGYEFCSDVQDIKETNKFFNTNLYSLEENMDYDGSIKFTYSFNIKED